MRLDDLDQSDNVRDLGQGRGFGGGFSGGGGSSGLIGLLFSILPMLLGRKMGCGTLLLLGGVAAFFMFAGGGLNLAGDTGAVGTGRSAQSGQNVAGDTAEEIAASRVLRSTEQVWGELFAQAGQRYQPATLNFYNNVNQSGCGTAQSAMGPFYCPADQGVYLDTSFFRELTTRFGAGGDAAQAYVIAHEVGHHIQTITGISDKVRRLQQRVSQAEANALQVRMELQADCYAGVWAARARGRSGTSILEPGDIEEAMRAASAIGDDTLQRSAGQRPVPESFTHGTSAQRMEWLKRGLQSGNPNACDTFAGIF